MSLAEALAEYDRERGTTPEEKAAREARAKAALAEMEAEPDEDPCWGCHGSGWDPWSSCAMCCTS